MLYDEFKDIFMQVLNHHAPKKRKVVRGNAQPFMNKVLSKAFMQRSKLKNNFNKNPTDINKSMYKKQRNFCVNLLRKEKKKYYNNLDLKIFQDNRKFWQRIKPLFSNKQITLQKSIIIVENDKIISSSEKVTERLNNFFIEAVENLEIESFAPNTDNNIYSIDEIIKNYERHPSILEIKKNANTENKFLFTNTTANNFKDEINKLDPRKASIENDIPVKILITTSDIVCTHLSQIYNSTKNENISPQSLKLADVTPIHKKDALTLLKNYRPVSLIPIVSKLFERDMYSQILAYIETFLSPYLFGYRQGYSTEQCLIVMLEKWKKHLMERNMQELY